MAQRLTQIPVRNVRAQTMKPVTPAQLAVIRLLADGLSHAAIAERLALSIWTVRKHINQAALRIPGRGAASVRLVYWYRGATVELLNGE